LCLIALWIALLEVIIPRNFDPIIAAALQGYADELSTRGAQPIIGTLRDHASAIAKQLESIRKNEPERLDAGLDDMFESFARNDALLVTHFPLKGEERFAEHPINEVEATGKALEQPVKAVAENMQEAVESGLATENIGKLTSNSAQFARDISALPPDEAASEPGSRRVSLKRRYTKGYDF
jgi:hypothetical protein